MKKLIAKYTPSPKTIQSNKHLRFLSKHLHIANLWHMNRKSVAGGVAVGLFCAWIPIPFQMVVAAVAAILFSVNLPVAIAAVWVTNPITIPIFFYFAYWLGAHILQIPIELNDFAFSYDWLKSVLHQIWQPLMLGSLVLGIGSALLGYFAVTFTWRYHVVRRWQAKQRKRTQ